MRFGSPISSVVRSQLSCVPGWTACCRICVVVASRVDVGLGDHLARTGTWFTKTSDGAWVVAG
jgi:hypothetical protein